MQDDTLNSKQPKSFLYKYLPLFIKTCKIGLALVFLLLMWLPFSCSPDFSLDQGSENEYADFQWGNDYLYEEGDPIMPHLLELLIVANILVHVLETGNFRRFLKVVAVLVAGLCFLLCGLCMAMPMQDFVPSFGCLLLGTLFPILLCWYFAEHVYRASQVESSELEEEVYDLTEEHF